MRRLELIIVLVLIVATTACGGGRSVSALAGGSARYTDGDTAVAVADVLAAPAPEGVDPALWETLTQELAAQLTVRSASDFGELHINWYPRSSGVGWDNAFMRPDGSGNGAVDIADIVPIAMYFGETSSSAEGFHPFADYNGNGRIDISDIIVIARWYGLSCSGFLVEFSSVGAESGFARIGIVDYDDYEMLHISDRRQYCAPCDTRTPGPLWVRLGILDKSSRLISRSVYEVPYLGEGREATSRTFTVYMTNSLSPEISWSTMSLCMADGNQDGTVNGFDIGTIWEHFSYDTEASPQLLFADYDRSGEVSIADVTPVAVSFLWSIGRFQIEVSTESAEDGFALNGSVDFYSSKGFNEFGFRWFEYRIVSPPSAPFWVRVVPYSFEDLPGTSSNVTQFGGAE